MSRRQIIDFARSLRELRRRAGNPSYDRLAAESGYPRSALATVDSGDRLAPLTVTLAYVSVCRGDPDAWADRWRALSARLTDAEHASLLAPGTPGIPTKPVALPRVRRIPRRARVVILLAALVTIPVVGTVLMRPSAPEEPRSPLPAVPPASTAPEPPPELAAVAGPGCRMDFTRQVHIASQPGDLGWIEGRGGSYTGDGCDDRFLYAKAAENYFQWRFSLIGAAPRTCVIEVFVPDSPFATARVWYDIADRFEDIELNIGQFQIDQRAGRGTWVRAATVAVSTAAVLVQIGSPAVAGPLRLTCSRS